MEELIASDLVKPNWQKTDHYSSCIVAVCDEFAHIYSYVCSYQSFVENKSDPSLFVVKYGDVVCVLGVGPDQILLYLQEKGETKLKSLFCVNRSRSGCV